MAAKYTQIPRSAHLVDEISGTNAEGDRFTMRRYMSSAARKTRTEWVEITRKCPGKRPEVWTETFTGRRLAIVGDEFDRIVAHVREICTDVVRTPGRRPAYAAAA